MLQKEYMLAKPLTTATLGHLPRVLDHDQAK